MNRELREALRGEWFAASGAYVLVDGQFGSTGKGVIAGALAECFAEDVGLVMSNAGPNSGHTSFYHDTKIVLKQLPTFAVVAAKLRTSDFPSFEAPDALANGIGIAPPVYLTAGAVIDPDLLMKECIEHGYSVLVHPNAAIIRSDEKAADQVNVQGVASTGQGVGPALIRKMQRVSDGVIGGNTIQTHDDRGVFRIGIGRWGGFGTERDLEHHTIFVEVSQGYSLGINSGFYPHVTTRECTVSQALSDAGLPPSLFRKSVLSVRTFPIRVGNTENTSGPCYPDQMETSWERIGVPQEYTTVTKRVRRVFTWSDIQFREAVFANDPDTIFCNFVNYLKPEDIEVFVWNHICKPYVDVKGRLPAHILLGFGPKSSDIKVWR